MESVHSMYIGQKLAVLLAVIFLAAFSSNLQAQALYSYMDESGFRVYTNIPPVDAVFDLEISGSLPEPPPPPAPVPKSNQFDPIIEKYANHYSLDPTLIKSIIATESGFNPKAVSPKGARGLMQLMPATAQSLGVSNSFDPEDNIRGGVKHFRTLMDNFNNDLKLSLAAYNAGKNRVQRLGRIPEIKETRDYVKSITSRLDKKDTNPPADVAIEEVMHPPAYRFVDESGILHLTNIPPSASARD
jgi:soluble lytic murein transglycosylase-like protein